jgi:hypothetical protein
LATTIPMQQVIYRICRPDPGIERYLQQLPSLNR